MCPPDLRPPARRVRVLGAGGTIGMGGDGGARRSSTPRRWSPRSPGSSDRDGLEARDVANMPSAHLTLADQLEICREARDAARRGIGVVVTHGTDTLEETAMLCDVIHDAEAPIVFTGAIRPATAAGRRRPGEPASTPVASPRARRRPGWACSSSSAARSTTRAACARPTRPRWSPSPRRRRARSAASPRATRRSGRGSRATRRSTRRTSTSASSSSRRAAGDDGTLARAALATEPDGVVIGTLGAGHLAPDLLELWAEAAERIPVVAYCRPERGVILNSHLRLRGLRAGTCAAPGSSPPASSRRRPRA